MGVLLRGDKDGTLGLTHKAWGELLDAAPQHGWEPAGTEGGGAHGSYTLNGGQHVTPADAEATKLVMGVLHHDDRLPDHVYYGRVQRVDGVYQPEEPGDPEPLDLSEILDQEGAE
jgi:hypothetical protein